MNDENASFCSGARKWWTINLQMENIFWETPYFGVLRMDITELFVHDVIEHYKVSKALFLYIQK